MSTGFGVSFLGSLPLGTLNITAFQIAAITGVSKAITFAMGVILIELIAVRISLLFTDQLTSITRKAPTYALLFMAGFLTYLAWRNFDVMGSNSHLVNTATLFPLIKSTFLLGIVLSVLNPLHIPFWSTWNSVLKVRNILDSSRGMYTIYIVGIGIGSVAGLLIFILSGKIIFESYRQYSNWMAFLIGCSYLSLAVYFIIKFYRKTNNQTSRNHV